MSVLPIHPFTGLQAVGIVAGKPVWPIKGGAEDGGDPPVDDSGESDSSTPPAEGGDAQKETPKSPDKGFPEDTPVAEMTDKEQAAYHKYHSRKHEQRSKQFGDLTPERYQELLALEKAQRKAEDEKKPQIERDLEAAKASAREAQLQELAPGLLRSRFESLSVGRLVNGEPVDLDSVMDGIDARKFVNDKGVVDADKAAKYLDGIAPKPKTPKTPGFGGGKRDVSTTSAGAGLSAGADLYRDKHQKKQTV